MAVAALRSGIWREVRRREKVRSVNLARVGDLRHRGLLEFALGIQRHGGLRQPARAGVAGRGDVVSRLVADLGYRFSLVWLGRFAVRWSSLRCKGLAGRLVPGENLGYAG